MKRIAAFIVACVRFFIHCGDKHPRINTHCERIVGHTGKHEGIDPWNEHVTERWS